MNISDSYNWTNTGALKRKSFTCGYCNHRVANDRGYLLRDNNSSSSPTGGIYLCPGCKAPIFINYDGSVYPGACFGNEVKYLPPLLESTYNEVRICIQNKAYTSAVLMCRKILMNIAVDQDADEGKNFAFYIDYLADKGYIPPNGKEWADHIRVKGNEATHEINIMKDSDAKDLITFIEMLLKFIYEYPNSIKSQNVEMT